LFYPTAIGWHPAEKETDGAAQRDAWRTVQRAHAIANGVYVAAVNRVGFELASSPGGQARLPEGQGIEFWGSSFLCDPFGAVIFEASQDQEEILIGEIDPGRIEDVRRHWPFLRDRRIDAYQGIERRHLEQERVTQKKPMARRLGAPRSAPRPRSAR
jgi:N-carbamoylputrescine amidase